MSENDRHIVSLDEFKRCAFAAKQGTGPALEPGASIIRCGLTAQVEQPAGEDRTMTFVVATGEVNRNGWRLNPQGWQLDNYLKNPVMLWGHDYGRLPVANATKVWVEGELLKAAALFTPEGVSSFNDAVYAMYRDGWMHTVSAGWIPLDYEFVETEEGWEVMCAEQELLEISFVPVPAEPNALRLAARAGIDVAPLRAWAQEILGEPRLVLTVPASVRPERAMSMARAAQDWYQGAKVLVLPEGARIAAFDGDSALRFAAITQAELAAEVPLDVVTAGVVPANVSTELAAEDEAWEAPALADFTDDTWDELSTEEKRAIAGHYAWANEMPPAAFNSLKLPHHRASDGKVVWNGVTAAMSALLGGRGGVDIPDEDRERVHGHLGSHYRAFGKEPPDYHAALDAASAAVGTAALATSDASMERDFRGTREWRSRQLATLSR